MRFVHLSDTHLGFSEFTRVDAASGINLRELDVYESFDCAVKLILQLKPDFVVHAGDLFHTPRPSNRAISRAVAGLKQIVDAGIQVFAIAGNHETPRTVATGSIFELLNLLGVKAVFEPRCQIFRIGDVALHCVPHLPTLEDLKSVLATISPAPDARYNILTLHCGVREMGEAYSLGEFNEVILSPDELAGIQGFDYIALGHYHRHTPIAANAHYSGSLERLSFREAGYPKGLLEVNLQGGKPRFHPLDCRDMTILTPVDCRKRAAGTIMAQIQALLAAAQPLAGKIVRLELRDLEPAVWFEVDQPRIRELAAGAFELRIEKSFAGRDSTPGKSGAVLGGLVDEFTAFVKTAKLEGLDRTRLRQLGEHYLMQVEEEVLE